MFNQNNEEPKLDWMYKGPNSTVDREEYLLGRKIDKTLEQINEEDKQKQQGLTTVVPSKNRVEHECIPPSIRDFNRTVQAEQVDLSTKLQEDPLVAIKKREEETRRQFLQNPIQLKKLQRALKAQQEKNEKKNKKKSKKKKKKKKSSSSSSDYDSDDDLDTILMHKFNELKQHLTENDLRDILTGNISDSSEDDGDTKRKQRSSQQSSDKDSDDDKRQGRYNHKRDFRKSPTERNRNSFNNYRDGGRRSKSPHSSRHHYDSDGSEYSNRRRNYGLIKSDGTTIPFKQPYLKDDKSKRSKTIEEPPPQTIKSKKRLTDEEKEKLRKEMMENAVWRDKERERNIKRYRKEDEKEPKQDKEFDSNFIHKQMMKSTINASVENRIKSNLNNIQRSNRDMDRNFSKR